MILPWPVLTIGQRTNQMKYARELHIWAPCLALQHEGAKDAAGDY